MNFDPLYPPLEPDGRESTPRTCEVEITDPEVVGYLYGPDGELIATLLNRRTVPFGFRP